MQELDINSADQLSMLRARVGNNIGRLSPSKVDRLDREFLIPRFVGFNLNDAEAQTFVNFVDPTMKQANRRKASPLEIALFLTRDFVNRSFNRLVPVLQGARISHDNFIAGYDASRGAVETTSDLALAYQSVIEGEDTVIIDVLSNYPEHYIFKPSSMTEQADLYLLLTERSKRLSIMLQEDPSGKSTIGYMMSELQQEPPNLDSARGPITKFRLRGVESVQRLYSALYDKAMQSLQ